MPIPEDSLSDVVRNELERYLRDKVLPDFAQHLVDTFGVKPDDYVTTLGWDHAALTLYVEDRLILEARSKQRPVAYTLTRQPMYLAKKGPSSEEGFISGALPLRTRP